MKAATSSTSDVRMILMRRSVPMLPDPIMATLIRDTNASRRVDSVQYSFGPKLSQASFHVRRSDGTSSA